MASVAHALTTTAKVKTYLGVTSSGDDTVIDQAVSYATDAIESFCGKRRFKRTTYTNELLDANGEQNFLLPQWPVSTLTTLEYRSGVISSPTYTAFTADEYLLYGDDGIIWFTAPLPKLRQGIRATYTAGYLIDFSDENNTAVHTLPFDIALVATELAAKIYEGRKALGVTTMATEGQSVTFGSAQGALTDAHRSILKRYQRRVA